VDFARVLQESLSNCHLHGAAIGGAFRGALRGVQYHQVSSDGLNFELAKIM